jgi:hypothetical protein
MKKWQLIFLSLMIVVFACIIIAIPISWEKKKKEQFSGRITAIKYGEKAFVYVTLNNKVYSLGPTSNKFRQKVHVNDSVSKRKGESYYFIFTKKGEVLKF